MLHDTYNYIKQIICNWLDKDYYNGYLSTDHPLTFMIGLNKRYIYLMDSYMLHYKTTHGYNILHECVLTNIPNETIEYILKFDKVKNMINDVSIFHNKPADFILNTNYIDLKRLEIFLNAGGTISTYHFFDIYKYIKHVSSYQRLMEIGIDHTKITKNNIGLFKLLLKYNNINEKRNDFGLTPLHFAVQENNPKIFKLFMKNGANLDIVDNFGNKPFDYITINTHPDIIKIHKKYEKKRYSNYLNQYYCQDITKYIVKYC